jgi:hypothetical protein
MKDLFKQIQEKNPNLSSAMCFSKLVRGRKMHQKEISKWFSKLVEKEDWVGTPREEITKFYYRLSNGLE